ncbi:hypothetical protein B9Z19DRAFT_1067321 [Tuber borchii]|uniref:Uncharacterized protein n=1 Tax=Tuber borchii TaxID=42251 RepID=A0A2T6ZJ87_TUBBO|nr:hypothetical protein B9Z19DRAFT_1067321 [Tuber borchii]
MLRLGPSARLLATSPCRLASSPGLFASSRNLLTSFPKHGPTTLKISDAGVIPFGPNLAIKAYQIPRQIGTEHFLFETAESDSRDLPVGYDLFPSSPSSPPCPSPPPPPLPSSPFSLDLMLQSSRKGPESTQKQVAVNFRVTSVDNERNDAVPELGIVVDEESATKRLTTKLVSVKKLAGPPLVWLDELEEMKDLLPLFGLPPLPDASATFDDTAPVDVDIEIEMEKVPCGTNFRCILDRVAPFPRQLGSSPGRLRSFPSQSAPFSTYSAPRSPDTFGNEKKDGEKKEKEEKGAVEEKKDKDAVDGQFKKLEANFKLLLKCFVGVVLGLLGAKYVVDTAMEARLGVRIDLVGTRIDQQSALFDQKLSHVETRIDQQSTLLDQKLSHLETKLNGSLETLESRMKANTKGELERLRLEIRNDRLKDTGKWW